MSDAPDTSFTVIQLAQLKLLFSETIREEFANIGIRVEDEEQIFEVRKDFTLLRYIRSAGNRMAQRVGWVLIASLLGVVGYVVKLGIDAYLHGARLPPT